MARTITKAELARWAGVSRTATSKACRNALADAVVGEGKSQRVDAEHHAVRNWLAEKGVDTLPEPTVHRPRPTAAAQPAPRTDRAPPRTPGTPRGQVVVRTQDGDYTLDQLEHLTVRDVVLRYGSVDGFKKFVESLKHIADYNYREQRVRQQRGELVERQKVAGVVFPIIDVAFARLVNDVPDTVASQVVARVESGGPETLVDVQRMIREANSAVLKNLKLSAENWDFLKHGT